MKKPTTAELAEWMHRADALERRVIDLQRTIDTLRAEAHACIAAREQELELLAATRRDRPCSTRLLA